MKTLIHILALGGLSMLATACSQQSTSSPDHGQVPGVSLLTGRDPAKKGVTFFVTPASIRTCEHPNLRMSAEVTWNVQSAKVRSITIWVDDRSSGPKKWLSGRPSGSARTGDWIGGNATLRMTDDKTGSTLAVHHFYITRCLGGASTSALRGR